MKAVIFLLVITFVILVYGVVNVAIVHAKSSIRIVLDGQSITFDAKPFVHPQTNRIFLPLRELQENLGANVHWDRRKQTIFISKSEYESLATKTVDAWGRVVRSYKLPKNAVDYPYVLKKLKNEMYEMPFPIGYADRKKTPRALFLADQNVSKRTLDVLVRRVKDHYNMILNVDYRKIGDQKRWAEQLFALRSQGVNHAQMIAANRAYVDWAIKNKIVIQGELIPEPSMIMHNGYEFFIRSFIRFRLLGFQENRDVLYDPAYNWNKLEKNKWYEGYTDVAIDYAKPHQKQKLSGVSLDASIFLNSKLQIVDEHREQD